MKLLDKLEKSRSFWFLIATFLAFFLLRLPSLFEPYWYGDEGIYQVVGLALQDGRLLYRDIWDNKPPLLYVLYALFSSDQFALRLVSLIFGLLAVFVFFFLAKKIFVKERIAFITTALFAFLFGLPILEGNIANSENFMLFPILLSALIIYSLSLKNPYPKYVVLPFLAGLLLSFAFLFKVVAIFDFAAILLFFFFRRYENKKKLLDVIQTLVPLFCGLAIPLVIVFLYFFTRGAFWDFFNAAFRQNVGYVGYGNTFVVQQGLLITKLLLLGGAVFYLFVRRKRIDVSALFVFLWFGFSLFNAFFSQRPYTHYLLVLLPSFVLLLGFLFSSRYKNMSLATSLITLAFVLPNFWFYSKTFLYYENFFAFIANRKSVAAYQRFFDKNTPRDYDIAMFLKGHTKITDVVYVWGNSPQIYVLANKIPPGRYTVAYHSVASKTSLKETEDAISRSNPKYIILTPTKEQFPYRLFNYKMRYVIDDTTVYERTF